MTKAPAVPLSMLLLALLVPVGGTLVYFVWSDGGWLTQGVFVATKAFNWIFPLFFLPRTGIRGLWKPADGQNPGPGLGKTLGWSVLLGVAISAVAWGLMWTPLGEVIRNGSGQVAEKLTNLGMKEHYLWFALFISFGNSAMEEYYWRWFVYGNLRDHLKKTGWANAVAALGFTLHHIVVTTQFFRWEMAVFLSVCVGVGGVIWAWMYQRQGTVLGAWVCHIVVDLALMWIGYTIVFG